VTSKKKSPAKTKTKQSSKKTTKTKPKGKESKTKKIPVKVKKPQAEPKKVPQVNKNHSDYEFINYFASEPQLEQIDYDSDPERILAAFQRIIWVTAKRHLRPGIELEDLVGQGQLGVCEAILKYKNPETRPRYNFKMSCLYSIRDSIFKYCIGNVNQLKTPVYIQRGLMHVAQIFQYMNNQAVAEQVLKREGPATEREIVKFLYDEEERLPKKSKAFIKRQINRKVSNKEFEQIYSGIVNHELGSKHSFVKNNLTDVGKILHIKEKIWYTFDSNNMRYERGIKLILMAREATQESLESAIYAPSISGGTEKAVTQKELFDQGIKICGELNFKILFENKCLDKNYQEIATKYNLKKSTVTDIIKKSIKLLQKDPFFQEFFEEL
jgi:RNA polymerase sigma factor (sigma-70 family)